MKKYVVTQQYKENYTEYDFPDWLHRKIMSKPFTGQIIGGNLLRIDEDEEWNLIDCDYVEFKTEILPEDLFIL